MKLACAIIALAVVAIASVILLWAGADIGVCALVGGFLGGYVAGYIHAERVSEAELERK